MNSLNSSLRMGTSRQGGTRGARGDYLPECMNARNRRSRKAAFDTSARVLWAGSDSSPPSRLPPRCTAASWFPLICKPLQASTDRTCRVSHWSLIRRELTMTCPAVQVKGFWLQFDGFAFISALDLSMIGVGGVQSLERLCMRATGREPPVSRRRSHLRRGRGGTRTEDADPPRYRDRLRISSGDPVSSSGQASDRVEDALRREDARAAGLVLQPDGDGAHEAEPR